MLNGGVSDVPAFIDKILHPFLEGGISESFMAVALQERGKQRPLLTLTESFGGSPFNNLCGHRTATAGPQRRERLTLRQGFPRSNRQSRKILYPYDGRDGRHDRCR